MKRNFIILASLLFVFACHAQTNVHLVNLKGWLISDSAFVTSSPPPVVTTAFTNEWNGPFASWDDIKTTYGAVGDGTNDDTGALSNAFANVGLSGHSPVVTWPAGTYKVTHELLFQLRDSVRFVRKSGTRPIIKASGAMSDHILLLCDRTPRCSFEGIIFDGNGDTNITLVSQSMQANNLFDTACQYVDCVFTNCGVGLITGGGGYGGSEVSILRDKFYQCASAGLNTRNFNALDDWVQDCEIAFCGDGLSDAYLSGAGGFHAYQCLFHDNTNDINIGNTSFFAFRDCLSTNSGRFMLCGGIAAAANITLQRNLIINPKILPCVDDGNQGQLALVDNTFLTSSGTIVSHNDSGCDSFSISNRFNVLNAEHLNCRVIALDDQVITRPSNSGTLILSSTATNVGRFVTNLWAGASSSAIQAAIYAVTNLTGNHPVVHLPWGTNNITSTIVIPGGADVQLEGDGFTTVLNWNGGTSGPVLRLDSPAMATLRGFSIEDGGRTTTGIVASVSNGKLWSRRLLLNNSTDTKGCNFLVRGCTNATIDMLDFQFGGSVNGMIVDNSTAVIRMRGCATADCTVLMTLTNNANVCIDEMWYESNAAADFLHASGSGAFSIQGFNAAVNVTAGPDGQAVLFTNWNGTALMSQGGIRDRIIPASGNGSLWINGIEFDNQTTNPLAVPIGLATFNANNVRSITNNVLTVEADYAAVSNALIRSTMALVRSTKANQNPDPGSLVIENVYIDKCNTSLILK